jgi:hypothetical protein
MQHQIRHFFDDCQNQERQLQCKARKLLSVPNGLAAQLTETIPCAKWF